MALQSQGCIIRRESSAAGTTGALTTNTIGFEGTARYITRQAGFADFSTGQRVQVNGSASNDGVYTISATEATRITVFEPVADEASGATVAMLGHTMQNIGEIVSFNGPAPNGALIDITSLESTAKEKMPAVVDSGQLSISVLFDNEASDADLHAELERDMAARTQRFFDVKFTDNGSVSDQPGAVYFAGYINAFAVSGAVDNALKADMTINISTGLNWISPV